MAESLTAKTLTDSGCVVDDCVATQRKALFVGFKVYTLNDLHPDRSEPSNFDVDIRRFLHLLELFRDDPKNYNGIRIYFATCLDEAGSPGVPAGQEGHLSLIMVPTVQNGSDPIGGIDDPDAYYHLFGNCPPLPDAGIRTNWLQHFAQDRRPYLIDDGRMITRSQNFSETTCLWYPMVTIEGDGDEDEGMIAVLQKAIHDNPNPPPHFFTVEYGCFIKDGEDSTLFRYFQLTILFEIHDDSKKHGQERSIFLGSTRVNFHALGDIDTGMPCPPASTCPPK